MFHELVNPNWHVILIHYPIALLSLGLFIEIITCLNTASGLRAAGRWMIGIGAILLIPTLTAGLHAFRDVVSPEPIAMGLNWHEVKQDSNWSDAQWHFMSRHIWINSIATGIAVAVVFIWLASAEAMRRKLYWFLLPALLAAAVLIGIGAWYGGETIYRYGTAVQAVHPDVTLEESAQRDVDYYFLPLQAHVVLAGVAVAVSIVAAALMLRRWGKPDLSERPAVTDRPLEPKSSVPARERYDDTSALDTFGDEPLATPRSGVYPGRFYVAASLVAIIAALFGAWSMTGGISTERIRELLEEIRQPDHRRLLLHSIFGVCIVILPMILAAVVSFARQQRLVPLIITALLLLAIGLQLWFGIAILYDGHEGPLWSFTSAPAAATEPSERPHEHHDATPAATTPATRTASIDN